MKLEYHLSNNFGDTLNPLIFNHFLPNFFDDDGDTIFIGLGSILGLKAGHKPARRKIVFSSGFAYGSLPVIDSSFDIKCVRGPLTCEVLNIDKKYAMADGAILMQYMPLSSLSLHHQSPQSDISFIPHWESALKFNWKSICDSVDINYINPTDKQENIINTIRNSKLVIAEALHGAIIADTLRIPWIPVKAYRGINSFKWNDWASGLNLEYDPIKITSLYSNTSFTRKIIKNKTGYPFKRSSLAPFVQMYEMSQNLFLIDKVRSTFSKIIQSQPYLSDDKILKLRGEQLLEKLDETKNQYSR